MGRTPYLTRLALGRSAFEPPSPSDHPYTDPLTHQHYDSAGRPFDPSARARTEGQVRAKNEVLEAVGVTERRGGTGTEPHVEDDDGDDDGFDDERRGEEAFLVADLVHFGSGWWVDALLRRVQAGLTQSNIPFSQLVIREWVLFRDAGVAGRYRFLTAGMGIELLGQFIYGMLSDALEDFIASLAMTSDVDADEDMVMVDEDSSRTVLAGIASFLGPFILESAMVSFTMSSLLQQLRLQDSNWDLPVAKSLLPWHALSPYRWAWSAGSPALPSQSRLWNAVFSPVTLCMASHIMEEKVREYGDVMADYGKQPAILGPTTPDDHELRKLVVDTEDTPLFLRPLVFLRDELLDIMGWSYWSYWAAPDPGIQRARPLDDILATGGGTGGAGYRDQEETRNDSVADLGPDFHRGGSRLQGSGRRSWPSFKTSQLSMMPSDLLGRWANELVWTCIKVPLDIIMCHSLVCAWQYSPLNGSTSTTVPGVVEAGLFQTLRKEDWGSVLSKIGLCLVTKALIGATVWSGAFWYANMVGSRQQRRRLKKK